MLYIVYDLEDDFIIRHFTNYQDANKFALEYKRIEHKNIYIICKKTQIKFKKLTKK